MSDVIYIDVLVAVNIFITWLLLGAAGLLAAQRAKPFRLLLASLLGGAGALLIFLPLAPWWLAAAEKLALSAVLVFTAFGLGKWRRFLRCFAAFFGVNFAFAGLMLALWLGLKPDKMFYQNGAVYFDVSLVTLILLACACYAAVRGMTLLLHRRHPGANLCQATIHVQGSSVTLPALYDSANKLTDGFTGAPVMVAEYAALEHFLPEELRFFFHGALELPDIDSAAAWRARLREIPLHALGQAGLLPAFRTDRVLVKTKKAVQETRQAIVAVTTDALSDGSYSAILQYSMLEK